LSIFNVPFWLVEWKIFCACKVTKKLEKIYYLWLGYLDFSFPTISGYLFRFSRYFWLFILLICLSIDLAWSKLSHSILTNNSQSSALAVNLVLP